MTKCTKEKIKDLTSKELSELAEILTVLEQQTYENCCTGRISGEFANAEMFNYDNDVIDIEVTYGIQSDCENRVNTEQWKLNRDILHKKMSIKDKVAEIYE